MGATKAAQLTAAQRRAQVLELVKAGVSYRQIASRFNVSLATIQKDVATVHKGLMDRARESAESWRGLELERLDALHFAYWQRAIGAGFDAAGRQLIPDLDAAGLILKLMERRARLLGLDKPVTIQSVHYERLDIALKTLGIDPHEFYEDTMKELQAENAKSDSAGIVEIPE